MVPGLPRRPVADARQMNSRAASACCQARCCQARCCRARCCGPDGAAAVSRYAAGLLAKGSARRPGRPRTPLDINTPHHVAAGVHVALPRPTFSLTDLRGRVVASGHPPRAPGTCRGPSTRGGADGGRRAVARVPAAARVRAGGVRGGGAADPARALRAAAARQPVRVRRGRQRVRVGDASCPGRDGTGRGGAGHAGGPRGGTTPARRSGLRRLRRLRVLERAGRPRAVPQRARRGRRGRTARRRRGAVPP